MGEDAMGEHSFSEDEVNALIPRLERIVGRMQQCGAALRAAVEAVAAQSGDPTTPIAVAELLRSRPDVEPAAREMEALLVEIERLGGEFKGLDLGLVDFPSELEGRPILLCWQYGEAEVAFYHDLDAGFAGRQPLPQSRPRRLQ